MATWKSLDEWQFFDVADKVKAERFTHNRPLALCDLYPVNYENKSDTFLLQLPPLMRVYYRLSCLPFRLLFVIGISLLLHALATRKF